MKRVMRVDVRLNPLERERLRANAEACGRSENALIRDMLAPIFTDGLPLSTRTRIFFLDLTADGLEDERKHCEAVIARVEERMSRHDRVRHETLFSWLLEARRDAHARLVTVTARLAKVRAEIEHLKGVS